MRICNMSVINRDATGAHSRGDVAVNQIRIGNKRRWSVLYEAVFLKNERTEKVFLAEILGEEMASGGWTRWSPVVQFCAGRD